MRHGIVTPEARFEEREDGQVITGYAAVYFRSDDPGTEYTGLGFRERIAPGAFDRTLEEDNIRGLFDHDSSRVLGSTRSGTMKLSVNKRGLRYEIAYDEHDHDHRQVKRKLERGDIGGSSFGFKVRGEQWESGEEEDIRTLTDVQLAEVSVVTFPAYQASTSGLRDEDVAEIRTSLASVKATEAAEVLDDGSLDQDQIRKIVQDWESDRRSLWQAIRDLHILIGAK